NSTTFQPSNLLTFQPSNRLHNLPCRPKRKVCDVRYNANQTWKPLALELVNPRKTLPSKRPSGHQSLTSRHRPLLPNPRPLDLSRYGDDPLSWSRPARPYTRR